MDFTQSSQLATVLVVYLIVLVGLGIYQGRKVKSGQDFAIAGRNLPGWVAALSERATGESAWCLLGLPGFAYAAGLSSIWAAVGCMAGIIVAWSILAWRLRRESETYDAVTFIDYIAKRHSEMGSWIKVVGSLMIAFFFFFYVGSQFLGGGKTFATMFNITPAVGMVVTALIVIPYTVYGGFQSVVYTDSLQAIIMFLALLVAPIIGFSYVAGNPDIYANSITEALTKAGPAYTSITGGVTGFAAAIVILGGFSWFFGYLGGTPQLTMRFMAIRDEKQAKIGRNVGIIWTLIAYFGAYSLGWLGIAIFGPTGLADPETVMPAVMLKLFHPVIASLFITSAFAAMISTADSLLILSATELSEGIIKRYYRRGEMDDGRSLRISRAITAILAVIALGSSYVVPSNLIYTIIGYVWAGIGCPFSVIILLTLFWKRFNAKAAFFTMVIGMLFTIVWIATGLDAAILTARVMTFVVSLIVGVAVTYMTGRQVPASDNVS